MTQDGPRSRDKFRLGRHVILTCLFLLVCPYLAIGQCGGERWNVKAGIDSDKALVNLLTVTPATIDGMRSIHAPSSLPENSRIQPTEITTWTLNATLTKYVKSYDGDYHIVFQDSAGRTMIGEIPDPACISSSSPFRTGIAHARTQFNAMFTATSTFKSASIPVSITGVGFFDYNEGQEGIAPNGIELHPIIDIVFGASFALSSSPASTTIVQGNSANITVNSTTSNNFSSSIAFSATGLPSGATATLC